MKSLLILFFLFLTTPINKPKTEAWVSSIDIYVNDKNQVIIYYRGNVNYCVSKQIIDVLYSECDSSQTKDAFQFLFPNLHKIPMEEICIPIDTIDVEQL